MLTPIDQIATQNHLQIFKAAIPYFRTQQQKNISLLIKLLEMQNILRFYHQSSHSIQACSTSGPSPTLLDILSDMRNYCEGKDQELLDQWIQFAGTLELYSMFSQDENLSV